MHNSYTCEGLENYCEDDNNCYIRDCLTEDCFKVGTPLWEYDFNFVTLNLESGFSLDTNDFASDPTPEFDLDLTIEIDLGVTNSFLTSNEGLIE